MNEQSLYEYYYNQFKSDLQSLQSGNTKRQWYVGKTSRHADELAAKIMPKDEQSKQIMLKAAKQAIEDVGYTGANTRTFGADNKKNNRLWGSSGSSTLDSSVLANSQAQAVLELAKKQARPQLSVAISDPTSISQDPEQLANNIIAALKNGQSIDTYIAMVPESPDRYFKSKFLYTIATNYPAKTPEVAKEMQTIAQRNELGAKQWDISRKPNWNLSDTQTMAKGDGK